MNRRVTGRPTAATDPGAGPDADAGVDPGADPGAGAGPRYDYLLVIGPGRSGSTFLYRILDSQPAFTAPEIKEGCYYRSRRRLERARRGIRGDRAPRVLLDAANHAWRDRTLPERVEALCAQGCRTLLVMLLREHAERSSAPWCGTACSHGTYRGCSASAPTSSSWSSRR